MPDYTDLEQRLRQAAPQPDRQFQNKLRRQLLNEFEAEWAKASPRPHTARRWWLAGATAAAGLLLLLIIGLTPAGQVIADAFLQFGPFTLTDAPSAAEPHITATPNTVFDVKTTVVAAPEAEKQTGFTVFYPRYLPDDYSSTTPPMVELVYNRQGEVSSVETMLVSRNQQYILYYTQIPYTPDSKRPPFELGIGQAEATPVMVGKYEGVWLEDFNWGADVHKTPVTYNVLVWLLTTPAGDTFTFWLGSQEQLPLDEMQRIAESMAPAQSGPANYLNINFGDDITLLGFELTGEELKLFWQANAAVQTELMAFVHWRDAAGMVAAQVDRPYSIHRWPPGQPIIETYQLRQPNLPDGSYSLVVGLYRPDTGQRLPVPGYPNDEVRLLDIKIGN